MQMPYASRSDLQAALGVMHCGLIALSTFQSMRSEQKHIFSQQHAAQVPYAGLSGIQAALAVMHRGLRPDVPSHTPATLASLIRECWQPLPAARPGFAEVAARLEAMQADFGG